MKHLRGEHLNTEEQKRCIIVWLSKTKKANGCRSSDLIKTKTWIAVWSAGHNSQLRETSTDTGVISSNNTYLAA